MDAALVPGLYDLVYSRDHHEGSSTTWPQVDRTPSDRAFPGAYGVLASCVELR